MRVSESVRRDVCTSDGAMPGDDLLDTFPFEIKGERHLFRMFAGAQMRDDVGDSFFRLISQATSPLQGTSCAANDYVPNTRF